MMKVFILTMTLLAATPALAAITRDDAVQLNALYTEAEDLNSDVLSSAAVDGEVGPYGTSIRSCMTFMLMIFGEERNELHTIERTATFAALLKNNEDRLAANAMLSSDLLSLETITSDARDQIGQQQGQCAGNALVQQKGQSILAMLAKIGTATREIELRAKGS